MANRNSMKDENTKDYSKSSRSGKGRRTYKRGKSNSKCANGSSDKKELVTSRFDPRLNKDDRDNDPNWYFLDAQLADQVSQLSMRNFGGVNVDLEGLSAYQTVNQKIPNVLCMYLNPSAGASAFTDELHTAGINQSGFRLYSKLAAFTGRALQYAPQDVSMMVLALGEVISTLEFIRRAFGVAYTYNQRNRSYPRHIVESMGIYADDLFKNYALYRNEFNRIVTRINQVPIPKSIAYFDKCASLYEKLYLDSDSPMAQTIITVPYSTWILDETSYSGGTILKTTQVVTPGTRQAMSVYLTLASNLVDALLNSSTLNIVYADIMNYFNKIGGQVWLFDYLYDGYQVIPEYNANFLLQVHNATAVQFPAHSAFYQTTIDGRQFNITPNNDVYPDPNNNCVTYSPAFEAAKVQVRQVFADFPTPTPGVEDRVEIFRFTSVYGNQFGETGTPDAGTWNIDTVLPDHYVVFFTIVLNSGSIKNVASCDTFANHTVLTMGLFDWAPIIYDVELVSGNYELTGYFLGDLNYYTTVDRNYLGPVDRFIRLALYDFRA